MVDHDPRSEDLDDLAGETAYCPECGAEVWDDVTVCPECSTAMPGGPTSVHPARAESRRVVFLIAAILLLAGFLIGLIGGWW